jgi:hypothetical protein
MPRPTTETIERRVSQAFERLKEIGFELPPDFRFDFWGAAERFTTDTLYTVFALARIIDEEQPLTMRRAFCRAVSVDAGLRWEW